MIKLLTAESVSPGHPDKVMDYIVDSILDEILMNDPNARVAIDGVFKDKYLTLGGEITTTAKVNYEEVIKRSLLELGYNDLSENVDITLHLFEQSPDIALGTNDEVGGAGDQGTITGYACNDNSRMIPLEKAIADEIMRVLYFDARVNYSFIKPDMKSQVTIEYSDDGVKVHTVVVACQHEEGVDKETFNSVITDAIKAALLHFNMTLGDAKVIINGTGEFTIGGPEADSGEVGRKIVVDAYGVSVPVGGGTYNGKDASKVDRSAAYYARYIAKNIVSAGLVDKCLITVSYCIGLPKPISVDYNFFGTEHYDASEIIKAVESITDYSPKGIIDKLRLKSPIYSTAGLISHYGLFSKLGLDFSTYINIPWESTDLVEYFQDYFHNYNQEEEN